jgi:hypothetical protein
VRAAGQPSPRAPSIRKTAPEHLLECGTGRERGRPQTYVPSLDFIWVSALSRLPGSCEEGGPGRAISPAPMLAPPPPWGGDAIDFANKSKDLQGAGTEKSTKKSHPARLNSGLAALGPGNPGPNPARTVPLELRPANSHLKL